MARHKRRWSDNDKHFGPFTYAYSRSYRPFGVFLNSGGGEDDGDAACSIRFSGFGATLFCELPAIIKPYRRWVKTGHHDWAKSPDDGYWDVHPTEYSISLNEGGFLSVDYGPQTGDSSTSKHWGYFLPWTQWTMVAHRIYGADGVLAGDVHDKKPGEFLKNWERRTAIIDAAVKTVFLIRDFDGEEIEVTTHIEEREWRFGTGWFRWLGYLRPRKIRRVLEMHFGSETGTEKGSWKGGLIGTSIEMLPGEEAEAAFRRYCDQEHRAKGRKYRITYVGHKTTVDELGGGFI